jgi:hypothetical protein
MPLQANEYMQRLSVFGRTQAKVTLGVKETVIIRTVQYNIYCLFYCSR